MDWSKPGILKEISKRLGLPKSKIYKWNWDRKRKEQQGQEELKISGGAVPHSSVIISQLSLPDSN